MFELATSPNFAAQPEWDKAIAAVLQSSRVLLLAHVTPDADALGSALGLGMALKSIGKQVQVSVGEENFVVPDSLNFLPGLELICSPEMLTEVDLVISCDVSSDARLGTMRGALQDAAISIAIDHHQSFTGFGKIHLVDPRAAATAEIVLELIDRLNVPVSTDIASVIYAGLATDTGSFKFQSTTSDTFRTAARLVDAGIDHSTLSRLLFDDEPLDALLMMAEAISKAVLVPEAAQGLGLVYTSVSLAQRNGLPELAAERVIEALRRTSEAQVAAVFKQADDGHWKVSLRSKSSVDVGALAIAMGGGGHRYASGFSSDQDLMATIQSLINFLANIRD